MQQPSFIRKSGSVICLYFWQKTFFSDWKASLVRLRC